MQNTQHLTNINNNNGSDGDDEDNSNDEAYDPPTENEDENEDDIDDNVVVRRHRRNNHPYVTVTEDSLNTYADAITRFNKPLIIKYKLIPVGWPNHEFNRIYNLYDEHMKMFNWCKNLFISGIFSRDGICHNFNIKRRDDADTHELRIFKTFIAEAIDKLCVASDYILQKNPFVVLHPKERIGVTQLENRRIKKIHVEIDNKKPVPENDVDIMNNIQYNSAAENRALGISNNSNINSNNNNTSSNDNIVHGVAVSNNDNGNNDSNSNSSTNNSDNNNNIPNDPARSQLLVYFDEIGAKIKYYIQRLMKTKFWYVTDQKEETAYSIALIIYDCVTCLYIVAIYRIKKYKAKLSHTYTNDRDYPEPYHDYFRNFMGLPDGDYGKGFRYNYISTIQKILENNNISEKQRNTQKDANALTYRMNTLLSDRTQQVKHKRSVPAYVAMNASDDTNWRYNAANAANVIADNDNRDGITKSMIEGNIASNYFTAPRHRPNSSSDTDTDTDSDNYDLNILNSLPIDTQPDVQQQQQPPPPSVVSPVVPAAAVSQPPPPTGPAHINLQRMYNEHQLIDPRYTTDVVAQSNTLTSTTIEMTRHDLSNDFMQTRMEGTSIRISDLLKSFYEYLIIDKGTEWSIDHFLNDTGNPAHIVSDNDLGDSRKKYLFFSDYVHDNNVQLPLKINDYYNGSLSPVHKSALLMFYGYDFSQNIYSITALKYFWTLCRNTPYNEQEAKKLLYLANPCIRIIPQNQEYKLDILQSARHPKNWGDEKYNKIRCKYIKAIANKYDKHQLYYVISGPAFPCYNLPKDGQHKYLNYPFFVKIDNVVQLIVPSTLKDYIYVLKSDNLDKNKDESYYTLNEYIQHNNQISGGGKRKRSIQNNYNINKRFKL